MTFDKETYVEVIACADSHPGHVGRRGYIYEVLPNMEPSLDPRAPFAYWMTRAKGKGPRTTICLATAVKAVQARGAAKSRQPLVPTHIPLPKEDLLAYKEIARQEGVTFHQYVRAALSQYTHFVKVAGRSPELARPRRTSQGASLWTLKPFSTTVEEREGGDR